MAVAVVIVLKLGVAFGVRHLVRGDSLPVAIAVVAVVGILMRYFTRFIGR